ncbi:alkaline phosphatase D [Fistulifera solaris]|uniref:Alkaline phosphatase D n=1 Tax=Fistulifera solaris TaxID=1519565 RepID=A0A1Z5K4I1_FISSO|nr:alkaline phosphatase D [Fistulifera solaris]|eukprot:GAX21092.1 alkaline phosphatase D [Fistulifera solaris]
MKRLRCIIIFAIALSRVSTAHAADFEFPNITLTKAAFGSCHNRKYAANAQKTWSSIRAEEPQIFFWTGDSVYTKGRSEASLDALQYEYKQMKTNATLGYSDFHPPLGIYGTWDDHDYGGNDAGRELPNRRERADLFWEFLGHRIMKNRDGVYSSLTVGSAPRKVKVLFLDTRWHREQHCIPSVAMKVPLGSGFACLSRWFAAAFFPSLCPSQSTLLGEEQWQWLEQETEASGSVLTLIVSSIQVLSTNPMMEGWGHFPSERDRLFRLISQMSEKTAVYILSGDVHHGEVLDPMAMKEDSFLEVTSSGLTHDCASPFYGGLCEPLLNTYSSHRHNNIKNYYIGINYGVIHIDWDNSTVEIKVRNQDGQTVLSTGQRTLQTPHPTWTEDELRTIHTTMDGHLLPWLKTAFITILVAVVIRLVSSRRTLG